MEKFKSDSIDASSSTYTSIPIGGIISIFGPYSKYSDSSYTSVGLIPCDGRVLNLSTNPEYSSLFGIIGVTYGGSGSASFNVPNLTSEKLHIKGKSNTTSLGAKTTSTSHSHTLTATNNVFNFNNGNIDHDHTVSNNDIGNMTGEGQHAHPAVGGSGSIGSNVNKNGAAGTAGGGLNGNHTHNVGLNSNNAAYGLGNNHWHPGYAAGYMGYRSGGAVSHTHTVDSTMSASTNSTTFSDGGLAPYQNVLYFIKAK